MAAPPRHVALRCQLSCDKIGVKSGSSDRGIALAEELPDALRYALRLRPAIARDRAHLERMLTLLDAGAVHPPAITRYKLADAAEAHRVSATFAGKVGLRGAVITHRRPSGNAK